jgi:hypothetical protein
VSAPRGVRPPSWLRCNVDAHAEMRAQEAKEFAEQNQMAMFIETSAKTADNINELFTSIARRYGSGAIASAGGAVEEASG